MQNTTNVFTDGLTTDMSPLTTKNNLLTDALNATLRTYNGNELVLQNDMGNTMIQDSTTGNIMGLRDGFVPIGMKEYGGILYIASYNEKTKEGELGTIPSPVINYTYNESPYLCNFKDIDLTNIDVTIPSTSLYTSDIYKYINTSFLISDKRFQVGDQFIINLNLDNTLLTQRMCMTSSTASDKHLEARNYHLISGFKSIDDQLEDIKDYGWFQIQLLAKVERSSDTVNLNFVSEKRLRFYLETELDQQVSNYWFINEKEFESKLIQDPTTLLNYLPLDTERCLADEQYKTYPNILPGYLYVKMQPELPENFQFIKNESTGLKSPNIFVITI